MATGVYSNISLNFPEEGFLKLELVDTSHHRVTSKFAAIAYMTSPHFPAKVTYVYSSDL